MGWLEGVETASRYYVYIVIWGLKYDPLVTLVLYIHFDLYGYVLYGFYNVLHCGNRNNLRCWWFSVWSANFLLFVATMTIFS